MPTVKPLDPALLCRRCDPDILPFQTTEEIEDLDRIVGQARAVDAVRFGIEMRHGGYNIFALGHPGTGRHALVRQFLEEEAVTMPPPPDWCYVNDFAQPHKPRALSLLPGRGIALRRDMERLVEDLRTAIPGAFETEEYRARKHVIEEEFKERQEKDFGAVEQEAKAQGIAMLRTPVGLAFAPLQDGEILPPDKFEELPEAERKRLEEKVGALKERLQQSLHQMPRMEREAREKVKALNREVTTFAVGHLIEELKRDYADLPEVVRYLEEVQQDVVENSDEFRRPEETPTLMGIPLPAMKPSFARYQVNLLVDHSASKGAPVIDGEYPTYQNLLGRIEHLAQMGALTTDFTLIKAGLLHRANGGYLLLDAQRVLSQPFAWEGLKQALRSGNVQIESLAQALSLVSTVSLEPEPIPLDLKVVLVGPAWIYYLLCQLDPDFNELFKVAADFDDQIPRDGETGTLYLRMIATVARKEKLRPLDRAAAARVIERSARLAGDGEKLSARIQSITDLLRETDHWAGRAGRKVATAEDVQKAIDAQVHRSDRLRERMQEEIRRGTILIDTKGSKTGQVNALSVIDLGQFAFGRPSRITARTRLGTGDVVDIEREVELGGPIHSKGVLILSSYLGGRYATDRPLSLQASLVFEQSYSGVEGDSASCAELYALLSALSETPIRQSLAVTGSVNQHGEVQAIGGVNEKIEGFFDLCQAGGLTGEQGVLMPASNVKHLMLRQEVVDAAAAGRFQIYAVETIDQGIELLTGVPAGERDVAGQFPEGTINQRVEARMIDLSEKRMRYGGAGKPEGEA